MGLFPVSPEDPFTFLTMAISKLLQGSSGVHPISHLCFKKCLHPPPKASVGGMNKSFPGAPGSEVKEGLR